MLFSSEKQVIVKSTPVIILLSAFDLQFYLIFVYHSGVEEAEALMSARRDALCKTRSSKTRPVIPGESLHSAFSGEEERVDHTLSIQTMIDCPNITTSPPPNLSK